MARVEQGVQRGQGEGGATHENDPHTSLQLEPMPKIAIAESLTVAEKRLLKSGLPAPVNLRGKIGAV